MAERGLFKRGHSTKAASTAERGIMMGIHANNLDDNNFTRDFGAALVQFSAGAMVSKITLPGDFSKVRIIGLPLDSTHRYILELLRDLGIEAAPHCVRISKWSAEARNATAEVEMEDPSFADHFCAKLMSDVRYLTLDAEPVATATVLGPTSWGITGTKVKVSWNKRTAWPSFGNREMVKDVGQRRETSEFEVPAKQVGSKQGGSARPRSAPNDTADTDIANSVPGTENEPQPIEAGLPPVVGNPDDHLAFVTSVFTAFGAVEFAAEKIFHGKRCRAVARFVTEADAREAVRLLHGQPQKLLKGRKLAVQVVNSAEIKISTPLYDAVENQVSAESMGWRERSLRLKVSRNTDVLRRFTTLRIEGEDIEAVADAMKSLEKVLGGTTIKNEDAPIWSPSLAIDGASAKKLKLLQREHDVIIFRDAAKKELVFFGPPEKQRKIQSALIPLAKEAAAARRSLPFGLQAFPRFCKGGYDKITAAIGHAAHTSLGAAPDPNRIISGSRQQYQTIMARLRKQGVRPKRNSASPAHQEGECNACWTEAEDPVVTSCKHVYCLACFVTLCSSAGVEGKEFSVRCIGEMATCDQPLALRQLQDHLPSQTFESILEASFASYIRRRPQSFHYCPCGSVYRVTETAKAHTCPACFEIICTACHEQHGMMTCAEYEDRRLGGYLAFEKYKQENGTKDCSKCKTPIEKVEGCNRIVCRGCDIHLCWVCLEAFGDAGDCYTHLRSVHAE